MKWPEVALGKICSFVNGGTPSRKVPHYFEGDIPWITGADVSDFCVTQPREYITQEAIENSATHLLPKGTVLLVTRTGVGKVAIAPYDLCISQDLTGVLPNTSIIDPAYLGRFLYQKSPYFKSLQRGATIQGITRQVVSSLTIPLPPLSEQRRIVEVLDQADALRKKRADADAKAERILSALFYKMFGDPATNPKGWDRGKLGDVIVETQYGTSIRADTNSGGIAVLRMNNIDSLGRVDLQDLKYLTLDEKEFQKYRLELGDILFNRTNSRELVGKTGLWQGQIEAVSASYLIRVRVDRQRVLPEYIWAYMNTPYIKQVLFEKARRAIGMANINAQELRALPALIPDFSAQQLFAKKLASLNGIVKRFSNVREQIDHLFQTLLHRAFSGDLTAQWREAHMKELLVEMEERAKALGNMERVPC